MQICSGRPTVKLTKYDQIDGDDDKVESTNFMIQERRPQLTNELKTFNFTKSVFDYANLI